MKARDSIWEIAELNDLGILCYMSVFFDKDYFSKRLKYLNIDCCYNCCYNIMKFEWDDEKSRRNIEKHGISFRDILPVFEYMERDGLLIEDTREDYGEDRFILFHRLQNELLYVVFTWREDNISIISARRANNREIRNYEQRREKPH